MKGGSGRDAENDEGGRLERWLRRKRSVAAGFIETNGAEPAAAGLDEADVPEADLLKRLGLPDPDTLVRGDDFSAFMVRAVPDALRRRALRRLWPSNPVLACVDGLNDYDTDFTATGRSVEPIRTAYRIGRGFLTNAPAAAPPGGEGETAPCPAKVADIAPSRPDGDEPGGVATLDGIEAHVQADHSPLYPTGHDAVSISERAEAGPDEAPDGYELRMRPRRMRFET